MTLRRSRGNFALFSAACVMGVAAFSLTSASISSTCARGWGAARARVANACGQARLPSSQPAAAARLLPEHVHESTLVLQLVVVGVVGEHHLAQQEGAHRRQRDGLHLPVVILDREQRHMLGLGLPFHERCGHGGTRLDHRELVLRCTRAHSPWVAHDSPCAGALVQATRLAGRLPVAGQGTAGASCGRMRGTP